MAQLTVAMAVPFETPEQVEERVASFEELFKSRFSKEDKWYAVACSRQDR